MKKSLLVLGLAVAAFTSCSNDEVLDINKNTNITFDSFVNKGTRAVTQTTNADIAKIYVYGSYGDTDVFSNVEVTKGGTGWTYENPVAWTANNYKFAAYATANTSTKLTGNISYDKASGSLTFSDYVPTNAYDLVAAVTSVNNTGLANETVNLTFKHLLAKVQFAFTNSADNDTYKMEISDIKFSVLPQGDCVFNGTPAWTAEGSATEKTIAGGAGIAKAAVWTSEDQIVVPNQDLATVKATFTATFKDASDNIVYTKKYENVSLSLDGAGSKWQSGYNYIYTASISSTTEYIKFNVSSVEGWADSNTGVTL